MSVLHPELESILNFYTKQRNKTPKDFSVGRGIISKPSFFSNQKLQSLLNNPLLTRDWLSLKKEGKEISLESSTLWKTVQTKKLSFMDKTVLNNTVDTGGAVVLEGLDILDTDINAFVQALETQLPCSLSNSVAFFSQSQNEAYQGHLDSDDVLVVQISGEKKWSIHKPQQRRYVDTTDFDDQKMGEQIKELTLRAGDVLYIKAGVPHKCQTVADHSLHLSFDLCDRTPNVEQMTHEANNHYNFSCEEPYASSTQVMQRYLKILKNPNFLKEFENQTKLHKKEAMSFRERIGNTAIVKSLSKYF